MIYMALCTEGLGKKCTEITITTETPRSSLILGGGGGGGGGLKGRSESVSQIHPGSTANSSK